MRKRLWIKKSKRENNKILQVVKGLKSLKERKNAKKALDQKKPIIHKGNVWNIVITLIVIAFAVYFVYTIISQQVTINQKSKEIETLQSKVDAAAEESKRLEQEIESLNDPEYLERIAREKLGLVRPNERVFIDSNKSEDNGSN